MFNSQNSAIVPNPLQQQIKVIRRPLKQKQKNTYLSTKSVAYDKSSVNWITRARSKDSQNQFALDQISQKIDSKNIKTSQTENKNLLIEFDDEDEDGEQSLEIDEANSNISQLYSNSNTISEKYVLQALTPFILNLDCNQFQEKEDQQKQENNFKYNLNFKKTNTNSKYESVQSNNSYISSEKQQQYQTLKNQNSKTLQLDTCSFNQSQVSAMQKSHDPLAIIQNNKIVIQFDSEGQKQQNQDSDDNQNIIPLSRIILRHRQKYYLSPIPEGRVLQCVVKRQKTQNAIRYFFYQTTTLRNFMMIVKDSDGYLIVSRYQVSANTIINNNNSVIRQRIVGRLTSNFFGTQFNCFLMDQPYKKYQLYSNQSLNQRIITIQYQTNILGLKGPRKMTVFIPFPNVSIKQPLNQIYQKQTKNNKLKRQVLKFKNKTPKFVKSLGAYVLNFNGRASVSSVKNFIIADEKQKDDTGLVLFGKFGKQLFNLDIKYPFNVIQAASLAISSFDRKLACQ